jgi:hypothetical protein
LRLCGAEKFSSEYAQDRFWAPGHISGHTPRKTAFDSPRLETLHAAVLPKTTLGKAVSYFLNDYVSIASAMDTKRGNPYASRVLT